MEPNLSIYQIALRYCAMALFMIIGAGITSFGGVIAIIGYVLMTLGVLTCLVCILGMDPFVGSNQEGLDAAKEDFIEQ